MSESIDPNRVIPTIIQKADTPQTRRLLWVGFALVTIFLGWSTVHRAAFSETHRTDFTVYTAAARAVVEGTPLYEAQNVRGWLYMYLPVFAVGMVPLTFVSVAWAAGAWYALSMGLLVHQLWMGAALCRRFWPTTHWSLFWLAWGGGIAIWWPVVSGVARGQASVLLAWLVTLTIWAHFSKRPWLAGVALASAIVVKIFPVLFLVYFAVKRQWTLVIATSVWLTILVALVPSAVFGVRGNIDLLQTWLRTVADDATDADDAEVGRRYNQMADPRLERNQSVQAVAIRLIAPDDVRSEQSGAEDLAEAVGRSLSVLLGLATAFVCWRGRAETTDRRTLEQCALVILLMLFASPISWSHSFTLAALPLTILAAAAGTFHPREHWTLCRNVFIAYVALSTAGCFVKPLQDWGVLMWASLAVWAMLIRRLKTAEPTTDPPPGVNVDLSAQGHAPTFVDGLTDRSKDSPGTLISAATGD